MLAHFALCPQGIILVDLARVRFAREVVRQWLRCVQALHYRVDVARVPQVLQADQAGLSLRAERARLQKAGVSEAVLQGNVLSGLNRSV